MSCEEAASKNAEGEIQNPVVFQCVSCGSIVGDSFSWVSSNELLDAISLSVMNANVGICEDDCETSKRDVDFGRYVFC